MRVRASLLVAALVVPAAIVSHPSADSLGPRSAEAAVSLVVSVNELVDASAYVVVAKAAERQSMWEDTPAGRRIVTYTRLDVERSIVGDAGTSVWVRTLGGIVGTTGQWVSGEATIAPGSRSLMFLHKTGSTLAITAMAQGHFPVIAGTDGKPKLSGSPDPGTLVLRPGPTIAAREVLVGASLERAVAIIGEARRAQLKRK